ncbi:Enoyl-[acyl-carrier-protein] reductase [NADH] [Desulfonatronum thiosulfatophilum]|uniref:Enoyl-[acyl-carrier-protein] reductase [NADH] n=1 Tax=Desulfonatronum thiosulfatophilum TaxID=617002 RepID=A0A1G6EPW3_9BACT|nr:enoyl-ACP reductase [Desulfonatronum thiosulfatophilum]SDB58935.1 Enoyl-[acyl-carrier-protein] reductase [NADH] [Desulfonatronum thiosulfatophilum]
MLLAGKKALIFGVANDRSIAYAIAKIFKDNGAAVAFNYVNDAIQKRVEPISQELGGEFIFPCDVTKDDEITKAAELVAQKWEGVDILVHSVAFANREDLAGRYVETSRAGFALALDVSCYSLVALCKAFEPQMSEGGSVMALSYYGAEKVIPNYNVMGVAKAALEASVRYLSVDMGARGVRVNAISAGPLKTLASSGISGMKQIFKHVEERAPLKRNVTQEDAAGLALFLGSEFSTCITGETIYVDAGYNIMGM